MGLEVNLLGDSTRQLSCWSKWTFKIDEWVHGNSYKKGEKARANQNYEKALTCYNLALEESEEGRKFYLKDGGIAGELFFQSRIIECLSFLGKHREACDYFTIACRVNDLSEMGFFCLAWSTIEVIEQANIKDAKELTFRDLQRGAVGLSKISSSDRCKAQLIYSQQMAYSVGWRYFLQANDYESALACYGNEWKAQHCFQGELFNELLAMDGMDRKLWEERMVVLSKNADRASLSRSFFDDGEKKLSFDHMKLQSVQLKDLTENLGSDQDEKVYLILDSWEEMQILEKQKPFYIRDIQVTIYTFLADLYNQLKLFEEALYCYRKLLQAQLFYSPQLELVKTKEKINLCKNALYMDLL